MHDENMVRDVLESAENVLATAISSAFGMIKAVAPEKAFDITKALVDDQIMFAAHKHAIKKLLQ